MGFILLPQFKKKNEREGKACSVVLFCKFWFLDVRNTNMAWVEWPAQFSEEAGVEGEAGKLAWFVCLLLL